MTKVFKDGHKFFETENEAYRVELPKIKGHALTLIERDDSIVIGELALHPEDISDFIDMLLKARNEYRKEFGYE